MPVRAALPLFGVERLVEFPGEPIDSRGAGEGAEEPLVRLILQLVGPSSTNGAADDIAWGEGARPSNVRRVGRPAADQHALRRFARRRSPGDRDRRKDDQHL